MHNSETRLKLRVEEGKEVSIQNRERAKERGEQREESKETRTKTKHQREEGRYLEKREREMHALRKSIFLHIPKVVYNYKAALDWNPHFLQTQVVRKPHSIKIHSSGKAAQCPWKRTMSCRFSHAKMFAYIASNFVTFASSNCTFFVRVPGCFYEFSQTQNIAYKPPSIKSWTWTEAAPKSWKITPKWRLLYTTIRQASLNIKNTEKEEQGQVKKMKKKVTTDSCLESNARKNLPM